MSDTTNRVQFRHWIWMLVVATTVYVLSSMYAEKSMGQEPGDMGFITAGTNLCYTNTITPYIIDDFEQWAALIERMEAAGGVIFLSEEDTELGVNLSSWCSTLAEGYPVVKIIEYGEYALVYWDRSLGFGASSFLIRLRDFQAGGLRL